MTQASRPQADNISNGYLDSGPYSRDQWSERVYAAHTGDENTASQRTRLRSVVPTFDNMLVVTEPVAGTIRVGTGAGLVYGSFLFNSAAVDFDAAGDAPAANPRIDLVCLVENNTNGAVNDGTAANGWIFPTDLTDYDAAASIPAYCARLVIVKGAEAAVPAEPALDVSNTLFMVAIAKYEISVGGVISAFEDRREFIDLEKVVSVNATENDEISNALILGVEVNDGVGAAGLGVGVKFRLENSAGTVEDAGQLAIRYTDAAAADETRFELRLKADGSNNLSAVINAPAIATADGNARGENSVDFQQRRDAVNYVASGGSSVISGGANNEASGIASTVAGGAYAVASAQYSTVSGGLRNTASKDYAAIPGGNGALADKQAQIVSASSYFTARGDAQGTIQLVARRTTAGDSVAKILYLDGDGVSELITIAASSAWAYDILIVGMSQNAVASAAFRAYGIIYRDNANNTTLQSVTGVVTEYASGGQTATVTADDANEALQIQFDDNGVAVHRVVATVRLSEVMYP